MKTRFITRDNVPEAAVTDDIAADLDVQQATLAELHIDRAYLSSTMIPDRGEHLMIFCKAWRVRNTTGRLRQDRLPDRLQTAGN